MIRNYSAIKNRFQVINHEEQNAALCRGKMKFESSLHFMEIFLIATIFSKQIT
jgi:hypothetical protein